MPFIILDAKDKINLDGTSIGLLITALMVGAMFSNIVWGKLSSKGRNRLISNITISMSIISIFLAFFASSLHSYMLIFFIIGASMDGNRIASSNLLLILAPEDKRPVYSALQTNILSFGMFFSILGGVILRLTNYQVLYGFTIALLSISLYFSTKLQDEKS